jgi:hypothetical protein
MATIGSSIVSATGSGVVLYHDAVGIGSTPNTEIDIISVTVPALTTRRMFSLILSARQSGIVRVKIDGSTIGTKRTGPSNPNIDMSWPLPREAIAGEVYKVTFEQRSGSPTSDVDAHLTVLTFT